MVRQVSKVTENIARECYYIMSEYVGNAGVFYDSMPADVEKRGHVLFVSDGKNEIKGFIKGNVVGADANIELLYVTRNALSTGVGAELMNAFIKHARAKGAKNVRVSSRMLPNVLNFYQKHGFVRSAMTHYMTKSL